MKVFRILLLGLAFLLILDSSWAQIPLVPGSPTATVLDTTSIRFSWADNSSNETGFRVWADPGSGAPTTERIVTAANATSWTMSGLAPNTQYAFQVAAVGAGGTSAKTSLRTAWTQIEPVTSLVFTSVTLKRFSVVAGDPLSNISAGSSGVIYAAPGIPSEYHTWEKNTLPDTYGYASNLKPNAKYTIYSKSRNGAGVETPETSASVYMMAESPVIGINVACDRETWRYQPAGTVFNFTNPAKFGVYIPGSSSSLYKVSAFRYAWDTSPTHVFTGSEAQWSTGTLALDCPAPGRYTLHLQSLNGDGVPSTSNDYGMFIYDQPSASMMNNVPTTSTWMVDRSVQAIACTSDTVYIGGNFHYVGPPTGSGVPFSLATNQPVGACPRIDGTVRASTSDGAGGWFIGGDFTSIGGVMRNRLAHILADGSVDPAWNPNPGGTVYSLARTGSTLYVGGSFTTLGGQPRSRIASFDTSTGALTHWNPSVSGTVSALAVSGGVIYIGGNFAQVNGEARTHLAALDTVTTAATPWNPYISGTRYSGLNMIDTLAVSGGVVYAGGNFWNVSGQIRNGLAALDTVTTAATSWNPDLGGAAFSLAISNGVLYVGGAFDTASGQFRKGLAAFDLASGNLTPWDPYCYADRVEQSQYGDVFGSQASLMYKDYTIRTVQIVNGAIYVGGYFNRIGGQWRSCVAALDPVTGNALDWGPGANGAVYTLAPSDGKMFVGGKFASAGGVTRNCIAALNAATGAATAWNPVATHYLAEETQYTPYYPSVSALAVKNGVVYAGGYFSHMGGKPRANIAALSAVTGAPTPWNPDANYYINALAASDTKLYVGGAFGTIGGQNRIGIAELDLVTTGATAWNANSNRAVRALVLANGVLYAGGEFSTIGGQPRVGLAALDPATGLATSWDPHGGGAVIALAVKDTMVYASGPFTTMGGQTRLHLAAIDAGTGQLASWGTGISSVYGGDELPALAVYDAALYTGGYFQYYTITGPVIERGNLSALDRFTGFPLPWTPAPNRRIFSMAMLGSRLYVGGDFTTFNDQPLFGLAQFDMTPVAPSDPGAEGIGTDRVTWTWRGHSTDEDGFKVWADPGAAPPATLRATTAPGAANWTQTGLAANTQYTFQAAAVKGVGVSAKTDPWSAWTSIERVAGLVFSGIGTTSISAAPSGTFTNLTAGSSGLQITNQTTGEVSAWVQATGTTLFTGLTPNTLYEIAAVSRNAVGVETAPTVASRYTLAPGVVTGTNLACNKTAGTTQTLGTTFSFTNPLGFGPSTHGGNTHKVSGYRYAWNTSPAGSFSGSEPTWNTGPLGFIPIGAGTYYLHVRPVNAEGIASGPIFDWGPFIVQEPPRVIVHPVSQDALQNHSVTFSVGATGSAPLRYQWYKDGLPITGANNSIFTINSVKPPDAGAYVCRVSNSMGSDLSWTATLHVVVPGNLNPMSATVTFTGGHAVDVQHGGPTTQSLKLVNSGALPLSFIGGAPGTPGLAITGPNAEDFRIAAITPGTASPLNAGTTLTLVIEFDPVETVRTLGLNAILTITTDSPLTPYLSVPLIGDLVPVALSRFRAD